MTLDAHAIHTPDIDSATPVQTGAAALPVSVWATAQNAPTAQRRGRYHPDSTAHPAKMFPAIVQHAVQTYTRPGDLVLDPMCGIGTTLVESLHLGRRAVGVEYESRWAELARTNIELAREAGIDLDANVYHGDARKLPDLIPAELRGQASLVITSPPYGDSLHGHVRANGADPIRKRNHRYGQVLDRGNLANVGLGRLLTGFTKILAGAAEYLAPGGHVVITARPWRQHAELVPLPGHLYTCGELAGLVPVERCVALLGRLTEGELVARSSFFQRDFVVKQRAAGLPMHLIAHEDVVVLTKIEPTSATERRRADGRFPFRHLYDAADSRCDRAGIGGRVNPEQGWLGRALLAPGTALTDLTETIERALGSVSRLAVVAAVLGVLAAVRVLAEWRRCRLSARARQITVLTPPEVDAKGALAFWAHLIGQLRPAWARVLLGQPHLGFEYTVTPDEGAAIRLWVPGSIPPGLIERAIASAWPGAHTDTLTPARPPLPVAAKGVRRIVAGGELRLGRREGLPLSTDHSGDLVRDLITAADDLGPGQAACVQILARPVTGRRVARATRAAASTGASAGVVVGLLREVLNLLTPGTTTARPTRAGGVSEGRGSDRQTMLEYSAAARAAAAKARGAHWETVVRYATSIPVSDDADPIAQARAVAHGRADALATVFGACTDHNYYRRRRRLRLGWLIRQRRLGRGDVLSVPELATIAHLPTDTGLPGLQRAGARALSPAPEIPVGGEFTKPLGMADTGTRRPVAVKISDARHHLHILGPTGVGKSTLLARTILDDADAGRGVIVIDPKGDLVTDVLTRLPSRMADRVVLFDADSSAPPPCVNPLDIDRIGRAGMDLAVDNLVTVFHRIFHQWWGPRTDDIMRASLLTLCAQPGTATLADLPRLLTEPAFRARVTRTTKDPVLRGFWDSYETLSDTGRAQLTGPLLNKLRAFLLRPFVRSAIAGGPSTVEFADILDNGGICLARLPKGSLGEETSRLVGSLLVARTWQAVTARARVPAADRPDAALVLDEAQNFLNLSTPIEDMLAEARGLRLSLLLAHQNLGQLSRELRDGISANARNKIVFAVSPDDARDLARHTDPWLSEHDLSHLDAFHAAARLLVDGRNARPFTLTTRPLDPPIPGRAREIAAAARARLTAATPNSPRP